MKTCAHAANTLNSDAQCSAFLTGCVTNGAGCVVGSSTACSSYTGNVT